MNKRGFGANSVLEGAGFFLAVFLLLAVLVKFIFFPSVIYADDSTKSLLSLEHSLVWANNRNAWPLEHPLSIGEDKYFVAFSKNDDGSPDRIRNSKCNSEFRYSCLCTCHGSNCNVIIECVSFKQFETITINNEQDEVIMGDGKIKNLGIYRVYSSNGIDIIG